MEALDHTCNACGQSFDSEQELQEHQLFVHALEKQDAENPDPQEGTAA